MGILRLAHVDVRTPDLELSTAYYTEVLGLQLAERGEDTVYLKCWDEEDHHSIRLRYDPRTGLDLFSFRVEHEDDLAELENAVSRYGCQVQRISRGEAVGQGESIRFGIPSGQTMELVYELDKTGGLLGKLNPAPVPAARHARDRAAAARPHADQRRGSRRGRQRSSRRSSASG